jgi:hypothetical protein
MISQSTLATLTAEAALPAFQPLTSQRKAHQAGDHQIGAARTALSHPLTHQLTVINAQMSHTQLTVSLRTGLKMVSQEQAAASQLLACRTPIRCAAAFPVL